MPGLCTIFLLLQASSRYRDRCYPHGPCRTDASLNPQRRCARFRILGRNTNTNTITKYACDTGPTLNKLLVDDRAQVVAIEGLRAFAEVTPSTHSLPRDG